jgi:hypothetical protein
MGMYGNGNEGQATGVERHPSSEDEAGDHDQEEVEESGRPAPHRGRELGRLRRV